MNDQVTVNGRHFDATYLANRLERRLGETASAYVARVAETIGVGCVVVRRKADPARDTLAPAPTIEERLGLAALADAAVATDAAVGRLRDDDDLAAHQQLMDADCLARRHLAAALRAMAPAGQDEATAVMLPDGTIAVRAIDYDGLAIVPPERIWRIARDRRDGHFGAGELAREGE